MPVKIDYRPQQQILIATNEEPYDPTGDTMQIAAEIQKILGETTGDLHFISDLTHVKVSFADLVMGMAAAFRTRNSIYGNPRVKTYVVGHNLLIQMGAKAASEQEQYGRVPINIFTSLESALAAVDKATAKH
jgi:hypothetical protein